MKTTCVRSLSRKSEAFLFILKKPLYRVVRIELAFILMFSCCTVFMKACVSRKQKHGLGANSDFVLGGTWPNLMAVLFSKLSVRELVWEKDIFKYFLGLPCELG